MSTLDSNLSQMKVGAVTLLDILGWQGIWQRKKDAIESLKNIIDSTRKNIDYYLSADKLGKESKNRFKGMQTDVISISDTIAVVTEESKDLALEFHAGIACVVIESSLKNGLSIRGATSYGHFLYDDNILLGPAIDEVASWYEVTEWIGVIQTPSAYFKTKIVNKINENVLKLYPAPTKSYGSFETYCANWPRYWEMQSRNINDVMNLFLENTPITPQISNKLINTINFYEQIMRKSEKEKK